MRLAVWTYEGPPHVGAMRVATAMEGVHYVLHAPQGDTYADLLFTMIERRAKRPPVTYTTFQARDLGGDTADLFKAAVRDAHARFRPAAMLVGASCTGELIQDDPGGLARALDLPVPVIPLELPSYQRKENWGASETFYQLVRTLAAPPSPLAGEGAPKGRMRGAPEALRADPSSPVSRDLLPQGEKGAPTCNILGPTALGFRHRDDVAEITRLLDRLGVAVNVVAPLGATPADLARLGEADFNVVLYPETAATAAKWLERTFKQPSTRTIPIGVGATRDFIAEVATLAGIDAAAVLAAETSRLPWYSRSVDSNYLTGKRVFIFGDATHAVAAARVAAEEIGFTVVGLGTYAREFAREVRDAAKRYDVEALITDDYLEVEAKIAALQPELVLGTQMERHIAKRLGIGCAVISAPVHVQDFPARYSPQMGFEGANVLFDSWVHPLMMGLEEHLIAMFSEDAEFGGDAKPSHLGASASAAPPPPSPPRGGWHADRPDGWGQQPSGEGIDLQNAPDLHNGAHHPPFSEGGAVPTPRPSGGTLPGAGREGASRPSSDQVASMAGSAASLSDPAPILWSPEAEKEVGKIPFFVRGKARRNTERFAADTGIALITVETLYDAKAHFGR